ncbi:MAG: hypothetical protein ACUVUF_02995, partial [Candidatus Bathycorpusculaceae bacterium]
LRDVLVGEAEDNVTGSYNVAVCGNKEARAQSSNAYWNRKVEGCGHPVHVGIVDLDVRVNLCINKHCSGFADSAIILDEY